MDGGAAAVPRMAAASDAQLVLFCQGRAVWAAAQWLRLAGPWGGALTDPPPPSVGRTTPAPLFRPAAGCH